MQETPKETGYVATQNISGHKPVFECIRNTFLTIQQSIKWEKCTHFRVHASMQNFVLGLIYAHSIFEIPLALCSYTTLGTSFAFDRLKKEVLAVKKVKSSLSSSRLQYPLLMLLLPVICGDGSSLGDSLHGSSRDQMHHSRLQGWEGEDRLGAGDHKFRWRARSPRFTGNECRNLHADAQRTLRSVSDVQFLFPQVTNRQLYRSSFSCSFQLTAWCFKPTTSSWDEKISPGWRKASHYTQIACIGTHIQSHSLAVKKLSSTKGVRTLHRHCVEYPFSRLRWMQKSPVHSEAAAAARKTAEKINLPHSEWVSWELTYRTSLPSSFSHTNAHALSLFLTRSTICGWSLLSAYKLTQTPSFFPLPPLLSLFLHATALCSTQDISHWRERERRKEREKYTGRVREGRERKKETALRMWSFRGYFT